MKSVLELVFPLICLHIFLLYQIYILFPRKYFSNYSYHHYKEFYDWSLDYAALGGNIEIVKWLYKNIKQEWIIDKRTIRILSRKKDHLKMIKFLYKLFGKNDEIFSKTVISDSIFEAKIYNNIEIMEYLVHIYEVKKY